METIEWLDLWRIYNSTLFLVLALKGVSNYTFKFTFYDKNRNACPAILIEENYNTIESLTCMQEARNSQLLYDFSRLEVD